MKKLNQTKIEILESLRSKTPLNLKEIAEIEKIKVRSANMHLLNLKWDGYVSLSEGGFYRLTDLGKKLVELSRIDREKYRRILSDSAKENVFYFYMAIDDPVFFSANNLEEFCLKIQEADINSIEFHSFRGDFESWVFHLGDPTLAKSFKSIRESGLLGEDLRNEIYKTTKNRCDQLRIFRDYKGKE
jgi:DNA-binding MarR family transcriptional regulator